MMHHNEVVPKRKKKKNDAYIMKYVANTLRKKTDISSFTPY